MKKLLIFIINIFLFSPIISVFARKLETDYPGATFEKTSVPLSTYVAYIFQFTIGIVAMISLIFLVLGGLQYITYSGNPEKLSDAKKKVFSASLGLLIVLFSWFALSQINPSFITLKDPIIEKTPYVFIDYKTQNPIWFCKEEIEGQR